MILVLRWAIELRKIPVEPVIRMWVFPVILRECNCRERVINNPRLFILEEGCKLVRRYKDYRDY